MASIETDAMIPIHFQRNALKLIQHYKTHIRFAVFLQRGQLKISQILLAAFL